MMVTLTVIGYFIYMGVGFSFLAYICEKHLDEDKVCVMCILYLLVLLWAFIPFTLMIDIWG